MAIERPIDHLLGRRNDRRTDHGVEAPKFHIRLCCRPFDDPERTNHGKRLFLPPDLEVGEASLGLGAPIDVGGDLDGAKGVGFDPSRRH